MRFLKVLSIIAFSLSLFIAGCGWFGGDDGNGNGGVTTYQTADYYPLGQGDTWSYTTTEDGETGILYGNRKWYRDRKRGRSG
jgi:hypothetical protein